VPPLSLTARPAWQRQLPNALTALRVLMAIGFFAILTRWRWEDSTAQALSRGQVAHVDQWLLLAATVFIVAGLTDILDGFLARTWQVETAFGRIMDPFADKILVVGAFVFLASADWWYEFSDPRVVKLSGHGMQVSGIYPWMVVVILGRELLVTSIRGFLEGQGVRFGADVWGKLKMFSQSVAVPTSLIAAAITKVVPDDPTAPFWTYPWGRITIDLTARITVAITIISAIPYLWRGTLLLSKLRPEHRDEATTRRGP
jgi:CDP-diacylglycerol--glycerol-3-phosphate 3-phosphatidyltransferase